MTAIVQFILRHGYPILFAAVFARQIGLPIPAPWFLLAAGALAASGRLALVPALTLAVTGCVLADWIWYEAGRAWGERVLHLIHRFAPDPEAADRRSKKMFARHGPALLVLDKFVPGLDAVIPPLAGTSGTGRSRFVALEALGATLWATAYAGLGYVFSHQLDRAAAYAGKGGTLLGSGVIAVLVIYTTRKLVHSRSSTAEVGSVPIEVVPVEHRQGHKPLEIIEGVEHEY